MRTGEQHEEVLFDAVRRLGDPDERAALLDSACAGNPALRERVEALMAAHDEAEGFFREGQSVVHPGEAFADLAENFPAEETVGSRVGRYKLAEKIGEGGCGAVYLAEQEEPVRRQVALKIIRLGMESRSVVARFEAERQALAMMDHPHIARVFDAGATERGSPYFVMEHVRGVRITEYCDRQRLTVRRRLDLFIQICHAIQHAHQKGIIHGDIKPSNIMVAQHDGVPLPKVIDFGISRAVEAQLSERTDPLNRADLLGTPAYMSPEQLEAGAVDVDTRSDIYSLGALLFQMLTGRALLDGQQLLEAEVGELRRIVREAAPPLPSQSVAALDATTSAHRAHSCRMTRAGLISLLKGDLDCIVMKALEKDRRCRYETADALATDIRRHLDHEPVMAHGGSWLYSLKKLVRRNRGVFVASGAVGAALVIGLGASTWLFIKERDARQRAVAAEHQQVRLREQAEEREQLTQAALMVSQERFEEADHLLSGITLNDSTLEGAAVFRSVGEWHAINGRWREAARHFRVLLQINHLETADVHSLDFLEYGPALIELGNLSGYERFRQEAIARFADKQSPFSDRIVKISLLAPANDEILASLQPLIGQTTRTWEEANASGSSFEAAWRAMSLALFEYRRGDYFAAIAWSQRSLNYSNRNGPRIATVSLIHAMALYRIGRYEEARTEFRRGRQLVEEKFEGEIDRGTPVQGFWFDWAFARILLREASGLLDGPEPGAAS